MKSNCSKIHGPRDGADSSLVYFLAAALVVFALVFVLVCVVFVVRHRRLLRRLKYKNKPFPRPDPSLQPLRPELQERREDGGDGEDGEDGEREDGEREERDKRRETEESVRPLTTNTSSTRKMWKTIQESPRFTKSDLNLLQLIKAGKEAVFYKARMTRGTCKGHNMVTCKISKEGVRVKHVETEVSIMRKLVHHKNILQLLDWNTAEAPFVLILEYVSYGTLRTFLQMNRSTLTSDPNVQSLLTIASYHIALALQHLRAKSIVHCDLALRNIMVDKFPWEVKLSEFGLARDLTRMTSRRSSRWRNPRQRVPLRWYPPEYFKNNYYSFKGDVWAFGIVLWEMQTFGTLPYPTLQTSESVVYHICIGHKNSNPEGCRPEILHVMRDCWLEPYALRPSFTDIVRMLENIMENDADYVDVESPEPQDGAKHHRVSLQGATKD
ncbi:fibroblast growth factor receptor homolog 1 [Eucyclogobius newberryi]|uniref:fibroblast growth factor receptor homolog 1 n=1 Tax=Eucyclogobius newberryi TaxID=166745 RepID=UPI003B5ABE60